MRHLTFVGLSEDGSALLLADSRGTSYAVTVDARLAAVLRGDHARPGQMEIALDTLTPKEIQARIRAGATAAELAEESGLPLERIERFEGPPLAERAFAAEQARAIEVRSGGVTLDAAVTEAVIDELGSIDALRWDAWRRDDGRWVVLAAYPVGAVDRVATWTFDARTSALHAEDETATHLVAGTSAPVLTIVPDTHVRPAQAPDAAAEPADADSPSDSPSDGPGDGPGNDRAASTSDAPAQRHATEVIPLDADTAGRHHASESGSQAAESDEAATSKGPRKGRRASVPSWDEILFGGGPGDTTP